MMDMPNIVRTQLSDRRPPKPPKSFWAVWAQTDDGRYWRIVYVCCFKWEAQVFTQESYFKYRDEPGMTIVQYKRNGEVIVRRRAIPYKEHK